jgi:hypothetical protein
MTDKKTSKSTEAINNVRTNLRIALALRNTKAKLAGLEAGLSPNALSSFIRGDTSMSFENVLKVCHVLEIPCGLLPLEGSITPARLRLTRLLCRTTPEHVLKALEEFEGQKEPLR